ncbi:PAS domain-containing protein, partial [Escherichia coli]|uniref:PAS domain-containing protein n=1 Tax=Escherichia coli TaxID=562 RepID=UPI001953C164
AALDKVMVISTTDLQGTITYVNDLFCQLPGFSREELVGQPHSIVRHPSVPKAGYKAMWDTIKAGGIWTGIIPNVGKGGVLYVVDTTV